MHECQSRVCLVRQARGVPQTVARSGSCHWGLGTPPLPVAPLRATTTIRTTGNSRRGHRSPTRLKVTGDDIYQRLSANGFEAEFLGHHKPPAAHHRLTDPGIEFYAEFVAPLAGSTVSRRGRPKAHRG